MLNGKFGLMAVCAAFLSISAGAYADERTYLDDWQPPPEGVVRDKRTAIAIAHAVWISGSPEWAARAGSVEAWQSEMVADLEGDVWFVGPPSIPGTIGGGFVIAISKKDGRILEMYLLQ